MMMIVMHTSHGIVHVHCYTGGASVKIREYISSMHRRDNILDISTTSIIRRNVAGRGSIPYGTLYS